MHLGLAMVILYLENIYFVSIYDADHTIVDIERNLSIKSWKTIVRNIQTSPQKDAVL